VEYSSSPGYGNVAYCSHAVWFEGKLKNRKCICWQCSE
jgi:hypothetical protein